MVHSSLTTWLRSGFIAFALVFTLQAEAQVCATPGSAGAGTPTGIVNNYYQGSSFLGAGASTLTLGAVDGRGVTTAVIAGDLLLIIQMQDGTINSSNSSSYGNGSGSGNGTTGNGNAGLYEFVRVNSNSLGTISFSPALTNTYTQAAAGGASGQKTYQVIRVPQYTTATASGVTAPAWNGLTGGVVALDVRDTLTLAGTTVESVTNRSIFVAGKGFRGAAGRQLTGPGSSSDDYATVSTLNYHGGKGEGFVGTPRWVAIKNSGYGSGNTNAVTSAANQTILDTGVVDGYPGGSYARGAPGNAGGGGTDGRTTGTGNDENAGGGGGGNYGPGGLGGRPWNDPLKDTGGRGGNGYSGTLAFNRVFMGGGGGAGGSNDGTADGTAYGNQGIACSVAGGMCSSGAAGGGIVILRARFITGSGVIDARGANGYNVLNDAGGGGGGGGSVVIYTINGGSDSVDVSGGDGGNAWKGMTGVVGDRHGPGGGGGAGFVAYSPSSMSVSATTNGGVPGQTIANLSNDNYGSDGYNGGIATFQAPNAPGVAAGALCDPNLSLGKTDGVTSLTSPSATTYTFTVSNSGVGGTVGTITVADQLSAGLSVVPGALALTTGSPTWACTAANATDITCTSNASISGSGGTGTFSFVVAVSSANGTSVTNKARVGGGGDPNKVAPTPATAAVCTGNNTPAGCAIDIDTVTAPILSLTKSDATTRVLRGATTAYTLTVTNNGAAPTSGTIRVFDVLPVGLTFSGVSPFTVNNFTCTVTGQNISCDRTVAITAAGNVTITFNTLVDAAAPTSITNLAKVGGGGDPSKITLPDAVATQACPAPVSPADTSFDPNTGCAADTDTVGYVNLAMSKDDGQPFMSINGTTVYVYTIQNIGTAASIGTINFRDVLPVPMNWPAVLIKSGANAVDWTCTRNSATDASCTSSVTIPAGGSSSYSLLANVGAATVGTQYLNRARVGGGGDVTPGKTSAPTNADVAACTTNDNPLGCAVDLNTAQNAAEIRLTKTHPNPQAHSPGDNFIFTLAVMNGGGTSSGGANTVRVVDVVPAGLTIGAIASPGFTCAAAGQVITCDNTAAISAGATTNITVSVTVTAAATNSLLNAAKVGTTGADPQNATLPTAATAGACTAINVPAFGCAADPVPLNANLQVVKTQRAGITGPFQATSLTVSHGSIIQYQIVLTNAGPSVVSGAGFNDTVPGSFSGISIVSSTGSAGVAGCASSIAGSVITTTTTTLPSNGTCTVLIQASATTDTVGVVNTATVVKPDGIADNTPADDASSVQTIIQTQANLDIAKTNGVTKLGVGTATIYTLTVTNNGPNEFTAGTVVDTAPTGLTFGAWTCTVTAVGAVGMVTTACGAASGSGNLNTTVTMQNGAVITYTINATVTGAAAGTIANSASVSPPVGVVNPGINCVTGGGITRTFVSPTCTSTDTDTVNPSVTKTFAAAAINDGQTTSLIFTLTNSGSNPAQSAISVGDTLPTGLTITSATPAVTYSLGCSGPATAAYNSGTKVLSGLTGLAMTSGTTTCTVTVAGVTNVAGQTGSCPLAAQTNLTASVTTTGATNTSIDQCLTINTSVPTLTKVFTPATLVDGGTTTLRFTLTNNGTNPARSGINFADNLPSGVRVAGAGALASSTCTNAAATTTAVSGSGLINVTGATMNNGQTSCTIDVQVRNTSGQVNPSCAASPTAFTNTTSNVTSLSNVISAVTPSCVVVATSAPTIAKTFTPATISIGATSTISFTLGNNNSVVLTAANFSDALANMAINATGAVAGSCVGAGSNALTAGQTNLVITGLTIPANGTCTVSVVVVSNVAGTHPNIASGIASSEAPTGAVSNTANLTVNATSPTIGKAFSPATIVSGGVSTLTITITNPNGGPITVGSVTDTFPTTPGTGVVRAAAASTATTCAGGTVSSNAGSVTLTGGTVGANATCSFQIDVTAALAGSYLNTIAANALSTNSGGNAAAASATLSVTPKANISVSKTGPASIPWGTTISYSITVTNAGPDAANSSTFSDVVPAAIGGVTATCGSPTMGAVCGAVNVAGNNVTSMITTLPASGTVTFTIQGTAPQSGVLANSATAIVPAGVTDPDDPGRTGAGNNTSNTIMTTVLAPDLQMNKTAGSGMFSVGGTGSFTLTPNNTLGSGPSSGTVTVTDTLPAGLAYVPAGSGGAGWSCSSAMQMVTCTSTDVIPAGGIGSPITINVSVGSSAVPGVTNTALVSGGNEPPVNSGNNSAVVTVAVANAAMNTFLTDGAQTGLPGSSVLYTHVFTAGQAGAVSFSSADMPSPAIAGWTNQLYRDINCNGVLDGADGTTTLSGSVAVNPGDQVCLIIKSNIPAAAPYNAQDIIVVTAMFTPTMGSNVLYTRQDVTTVGAPGGSGLTLMKLVRNVTQGGIAGTTNSARPGDTLEYVITYTNTASSPVMMIVISDNTPVFTTFAQASCGAPLPAALLSCAVTVQPMVGAGGNIQWSLTGPLNGAQSGTVLFRATVQ